MSQIKLIEVPTPAVPEGIELRCCSVEALIKSGDTRGAKLCIADPPWAYNNAPGNKVNPGKHHYQTYDESSIVSALSDLWSAVGGSGCRLAMWCTWPKLGEWTKAVSSHRKWMWRYTSGGSWHKKRHGGVGYHWLGHSELVLLYVKGSPGCIVGPLANAFDSVPEGHSVKPAEWIVQWIERWTKPGDLVVDLYAGLGSVAIACAWTGRRYLGAELDPARHRQALDRIAIHARDRQA